MNPTAGRIIIRLTSRRINPRIHTIRGRVGILTIHRTLTIPVLIGVNPRFGAKMELKIHSPELTQDEINRMQLGIGLKNAGQIKYAANVAGIVFLVYIAYLFYCGYNYFKA